MQFQILKDENPRPNVVQQCLLWIEQEDLKN